MLPETPVCLHLSLSLPPSPLQTEMPKMQVKYLLTFIPGCDSAELSNAGVLLDATYCSYVASKKSNILTKATAMFNILHH